MVHKIKKNFSEYEKIISEPKKVLKNPLILQKNKRDPYFRYKGTVELSNSKNTIGLEVRTKANCTGHHEFKIFAKQLHQEPCFRFESDGPPHSNSFDYIPLSQRSIPTPHFHRFNNKGDMLAYQTSFLKLQTNVTAIRTNPSLAFKHFGEETPLIDEKGNEAGISIEGELDLHEKPFDPMETLGL